MMKQQYFSDSEWVTLLETPRQAIIATILADKSDLVSFLQEVQASFQILMAEVQREDITSDLVQSVTASLKEAIAQSPIQGDALIEQQQFELLKMIQGFTSASEGQKQAIAHLTQVRDILLNKVPIMQAEEFKQWILGIATQVAKAVKEEGRFGIGGERVSRPESSALSSIEGALTFKL